MSLTNDPRLTAYALGELPEADRAAFEALLANDAEALAEIESIRAMAGALTSELKQEPLPAGQARVMPTAPIIRRRWRALAVAASVAVMGIVGAMVLKQSRQVNELAIVDGKDTQVAQSETQFASTQLASNTAREANRDPLVALESSISAKKDVVRFNIDSALAAAEMQSASGNLVDANVALIKAQLARESNPEHYTSAELTEMDSKIAAARKRVLDVERSASIARGPVPKDDRREQLKRSVADGEDLITTADQAQALIPDLLTFPGEWPDSAAMRDATLAREKGGLTDQATEAFLVKQLPELRFDEVPLVDVVEFIRDTTDANVFVNWSAIEDLGIDKKTPVSLKAKNVRFNLLLQNVLDAADKQQRLSFAVQDGVIVMTTREEIAKLPPRADFNTESYARIYDNPFLDARGNPLSTFSVDVDTASYANVRRYLQSNRLPPPDAVRIEELINYFPTSDAPPTDGRPFAVYSEVASCPWSPTHQLVRVAIKGKEIANAQRPVSNLVFLLDVSGSMNEPNKLPLVKESMRKLLDQLGENDRVAIVVYAGASGLALPSTSATNKEQIHAAIENLAAGGSTNGAQGIELAYAQAQANFITGGTNRVILCTDGDFNVGVTDRGQLTRLIEEKAKAGVFLSVLGFGTGNTKDDTMEQLADKGNGNYAYIDSEREAEKVLVKEMSGTLVTIAKDVKLQLEFNPSKVKSYRLIGYENRVLAKEDFNNDLKDAGEIGAGHHVVALYEIEPNRPVTDADRERMRGEVDRLKAELKQANAKVESTTAAVRAGTDDGSKLVELIRQGADLELQLARAVARSDALLHGSETASTQPRPATDPLKYQNEPDLPGRAKLSDLLTLKLRYKAPDAPLEQGTSELIEFTLADSDRPMEQASKDFQFASAVAGFGMLLRDSPHKGELTWDQLSRLAEQGGGEDREGYRAEFRRLVDVARSLK